MSTESGVRSEHRQVWPKDYKQGTTTIIRRLKFKLWLSSIWWILIWICFIYFSLVNIKNLLFYSVIFLIIIAVILDNVWAFKDVWNLFMKVFSWLMNGMKYLRLLELWEISGYRKQTNAEPFIQIKCVWAREDIDDRALALYSTHPGLILQQPIWSHEHCQKRVLSAEPWITP